MSRDICIYQEFLTEAHKAQIQAACQETGFVPHFFTLDQFEEAKACLHTARCCTPTPPTCCGRPLPR